MRLLFSFLLFTFYFASSAQIPSYVPTNGLVGWWPFNGNANDESGNGNNGVVNGATLTSDRFGNVNSAYSFDGVGNFINVTNPSSVNFATGQSFTVSFWLDADTTMQNTFAGLISKHALYNNQPYNGWQITRTRTKLAYETNSCYSFDLYTISHLNWKHMVYVFDRTSNNLFVYEDGILVASNSCPTLATQIMTTPYDLKFGVERTNIAYTKGKIDDIAIYNRALTQTEITQLYTGTVTSSTPEDTTSNVGIGTTTPKRKLHVNDVMRLEPRNTPPVNPSKGDIYFDGVLNKLRVYDGSVWQSCW